MKLTFVYLPSAANVLTDEEWQGVEQLLLENPSAGVVIPGTDGVRKLRVASRGHGKSGGVRTIYLHVSHKEKVYFLLAYAKNVQENITSDQKRQIRQLVAVLKQ